MSKNTRDQSAHKKCRINQIKKQQNTPGKRITEYNTTRHKCEGYPESKF
jgi:hypothetical protein